MLAQFDNQLEKADQKELLKLLCREVHAIRFLVEIPFILAIIFIAIGIFAQ